MKVKVEHRDCRGLLKKVMKRKTSSDVRVSESYSKVKSSAVSFTKKAIVP